MKLPAAGVSIGKRLEAEVASHRMLVDSSQRQAAQALDELSARLQQPSSLAEKVRSRLRRGDACAPRGLYLWGGVGRGKTLLMDMFYDSLQIAQRQRTHFYRFMRQVHAELRSINDRTEPLDIVAATLAAQARVLCVDEFFVSDIADAMILSGLLKGLFKRGVTLVATSNVAPQALYKDGLQRQRFLPAIASIEAHVTVLNLDGGIDYRLRQLEQAPTYLDSTQPGTPQQFAARFAALSSGAAARSTTLHVEGRSIAALGVAPGLAWFDFAEICDGPRSQIDYIEIARLYHTVLISNIPLFTVENENAARRFIMLIDEFYDRNVNIIVSAAAEPAALYHGERLIFEFERAASRLIEMQTQRYLAGGHRP